MPVDPLATHKPQYPRLPKSLPPADLPEGRLADRAQYAGCQFSGLNLFEQSAQNVLVEQSHFRTVNLGRTRLSRLHLVDVRFERCDLSGAEWEQARLQRV